MVPRAAYHTLLENYIFSCWTIHGMCIVRNIHSHLLHTPDPDVLYQHAGSFMNGFFIMLNADLLNLPIFIASAISTGWTSYIAVDATRRSQKDPRWKRAGVLICEEVEQDILLARKYRNKSIRPGHEPGALWARLKPTGAAEEEERLDRLRQQREQEKRQQQEEKARKEKAARKTTPTSSLKKPLLSQV